MGSILHTAPILIAVLDHLGRAEIHVLRRLIDWALQFITISVERRLDNIYPLYYCSQRGRDVRVFNGEGVLQYVITFSRGRLVRLSGYAPYGSKMIIYYRDEQVYKHHCVFDDDICSEYTAEFVCSMLKIDRGQPNEPK